MAPQNKHALVLGSSGVSGWGLVNQLLSEYPEKGTWGKVTALTNRPLSREQSSWPANDALNIVAGIDLLEGSQDELERLMKDKISAVNTVTHVFYFGKIAMLTCSPEV